MSFVAYDYLKTEALELVVESEQVYLNVNYSFYGEEKPQLECPTGYGEGE